MNRSWRSLDSPLVLVSSSSVVTRYSWTHCPLFQDTYSLMPHEFDWSNNVLWFWFIAFLTVCECWNTGIPRGNTQARMLVFLVSRDHLRNDQLITSLPHLHEISRFRPITSYETSPGLLRHSHHFIQDIVSILLYLEIPCHNVSINTKFVHVERLSVEQRLLEDSMFRRIFWQFFCPKWHKNHTISFIFYHFSTFLHYLNIILVVEI